MTRLTVFLLIIGIGLAILLFNNGNDRIMGMEADDLTAMTGSWAWKPMISAA